VPANGRVSSPEKKLVAGVEGEGWWRSERGAWRSSKQGLLNHGRY